MTTDGPIVRENAMRMQIQIQMQMQMQSCLSKHARNEAASNEQQPTSKQARVALNK